MAVSDSIYEEKNFRKLFDEYYAALHRFAVSILNSDHGAEDIVQEIFATIWEKRLKFENETALKTYLYKSVRNRALNQLKSESIRQKYANTKHEQEEVEDSHLFKIIEEEVYREIRDAIESLPPQCKLIYKMACEGDKAAEIAEKLQLSVETVNSQKKRAKKLLKERLSNISYFIVLLHLWEF